jgi:hypothetical protein
MVLCPGPRLCACARCAPQRVVRHKAFRKILRFYKISFGLKPPYKVPVTGWAAGGRIGLVCVAALWRDGGREGERSDSTPANPELVLI